MHTVLIVEDTQIVREGLAALIAACPGFTCAGQAAGGLEGCRMARSLEPDVVLMDLEMPDLPGHEAIARIRRECPAARILALTGHKEAEYLAKALHAGTHGYALKSISIDELAEAMRTVLAGQFYASKTLHPETVNRCFQGGMKPAELSERETEVLRLAAKGLSNREMAEALCISPRTVEKHKSNIKSKLGLATRADLVDYALRQGLLA